MAVVLPPPTTANETHRVSLNNTLYELTYRFNTREDRWRITLSLQGEPFITGVKVMENQFLLRSYEVSKYIDGDILCLRNYEDGLPVGRNNLGTDKPYELIYLTSSEVIALESEE